MTATPMVDQMNRLVGNLLADGTGVFLPGVGSLFTEWRPVQRLPKRMIAPPCRVVSFTSQQRGVSLVDQIACAAGCDGADAQDVYDRWLLRVKTEDTLTVEGVGVLKFKNFTPEEAFDLRLNPGGHTPVRIRSSHGSDWVLWLGVVAILVAVGVVGYQYWADFKPQTEEIEVVAEPVSEPVSVAEADSDDMLSIASDSVAHAALEQPAATQPSSDQPVASLDASRTAASQSPAQKTAGQTATPAAPGTFTPGHLYVVLGVFSTAENAARAVADALSKEPSLRCGVYRFGEKLLVSPFESSDAEACTRFIRERADRFPGMWTYTAR